MHTFVKPSCRTGVRNNENLNFDETHRPWIVNRRIASIIPHLVSQCIHLGKMSDADLVGYKGTSRGWDIVRNDRIRRFPSESS